MYVRTPWCETEGIALKSTRPTHQPLNALIKSPGKEDEPKVVSTLRNMNIIQIDQQLKYKFAENWIHLQQ
jgi:hypothetical protein